MFTIKSMRTDSRNKLLTALSLAVLASSSINLIAFDASSAHGPEDFKQDHGTKSKGPSATGLDAKTLKLVNKGDWLGAIDVLSKATAGESEPSRNDGWLAFAYMFQGKCPECKELAQRVAGYKGTTGDQVAAQVVQIYGQVCDGKLDDANKALEALVKDNGNDVLINFTIAAVAGKRGQAADAVRSCRKAVELAPDFAWGYRTLGFIEDRWLKDMDKAEADYEKAVKAEPEFQEARDLLVDVRLIRNNFDGAIDAAEAGIKNNPHNAKNYYRLAQIYIQQWRLREALAQLQKAIASNPNEAKYHRTKATILRYQGQLDLALKEQQAAVDLSKDKAFELVEMASLNQMAGNTNRAADNLRDALKLDPDNSAAHLRLVQLLLEEKRYDDLTEEFKRAIERKPKDASLHLGLARALKASGKIDAAIDELKAAANLDTKDAVPHREMGTILIARKDYGAAAKEYTRALNINPSSVEDLVSLGYCYAQNEDYLQAEAALVTAIALQQLSGPQPNSTVNHLDLMRSLAALLLEEGRYADAASQLEAVCAASKIAANSPYDQFLLAEAKAMRDRTNSTAKDLTEAYEKLSDDQKDQQKYAVIDSFLTADKFDQAQEIINKLIAKSDKPDIQLLIFSSRAWAGKNDPAKALDTATQAVAIKDAESDKACDAQLQLGRVLLQKGDNEGAEQATKKAADLNPKSYAAYEVAGRISLKKSDYPQAIASGKRALEINPYFANAYLLVGDANAASGHWKDAADSYKKAVELYPGLLEAHKSLVNAYKKLALNDEAKKEEEQIAQIEKRD